MYVYMYVCMYACMYVCRMYVGRYVYMYVCMYVYIYMCICMFCVFPQSPTHAASPTPNHTKPATAGSSALQTHAASALGTGVALGLELLVRGRSERKAGFPCAYVHTYIAVSVLNIHVHMSRMHMSAHTQIYKCMCINIDTYKRFYTDAHVYICRYTYMHMCVFYTDFKTRGMYRKSDTACLHPG